MNRSSKGQISLDLMMAVLVTIIVLGTFMVMVRDIQDNYKEMYVENQLKKSSSEMAAFITSSSSMQGMDYQTELKVPLINYDSSKTRITVNLTNDTITAEVTLGKTISYTSKFSNASGAIITYNEDNRLLVIESA